MTLKPPPGWNWYTHSDVASFQHGVHNVAILSLGRIPAASRDPICAYLCHALAAHLTPDDEWHAEQDSIGKEIATLEDEVSA